jgi:hypothetical protein
MLAACSGGSGGGTPVTPVIQPSNNPGPPGGGTLADAVAAINSVSAPVQGKDPDEDAAGTTAGSGKCTVEHGQFFEFFVPDKAGDANSSERIRFYDGACSLIAVDTVRVWQQPGANGALETVKRTVTKYTKTSQSSPSSVRTQAVTYSGTSTTFDSFGYPIFAAGLSRAATSTIQVGGSTISTLGDEFVVASINDDGTNTTTTFCEDNAGFGNTGIQSLNSAFGWTGSTDSNNGTMSYADATPDTVTVNGNRKTASYQGPVGSLSVTSSGKATTSCPIATPQYSINVAGGVQGGTFSVAPTIVYQDGYLYSMTLTNAKLSNGETLTIATNTSLPAGQTGYITGTLLASDGSTIATYSLNAYGMGLVNVATGQQFTVADWHVVN